MGVVGGGGRGEGAETLALGDCIKSGVSLIPVTHFVRMNQEPSAATASSASSAASSSPSSVSFKQNGKKFFRIGEKKPICVVPDIFASEIRINIREYYTLEKDLLSSESDSEDNTKKSDQPFLYPTKKGVSLTLGEFETLCANIENVKVQVSRLKKKLQTTTTTSEDKKKKPYNRFSPYNKKH